MEIFGEQQRLLRSISDQKILSATNYLYFIEAILLGKRIQR